MYNCGAGSPGTWSGIPDALCPGQGGLEKVQGRALKRIEMLGLRCLSLGRGRQKAIRIEIYETVKIRYSLTPFLQS